MKGFGCSHALDSCSPAVIPKALSASLTPSRPAREKGPRTASSPARTGTTLGEAPHPGSPHLRRSCRPCAETQADRPAQPESTREWLSSLWRVAFPRIGKLPVSEVSSADVLEILTPNWHRSVENPHSLRIPAFCRVFPRGTLLYGCRPGNRASDRALLLAPAGLSRGFFRSFGACGKPTASRARIEGEKREAVGFPQGKPLNLSQLTASRYFLIFGKQLHNGK